MTATTTADTERFNAARVLTDILVSPQDVGAMADMMLTLFNQAGLVMSRTDMLELTAQVSEGAPAYVSEWLAARFTLEELEALTEVYQTPAMLKFHGMKLSFQQDMLKFGQDMGQKWAEGKVAPSVHAPPSRKKLGVRFIN